MNQNPQLPQDWQVSATTLKARFELMFNSKLYPDVHFLVGKDDVKRIPGHKILTAGSPYFEAMFYGSLATEETEIPLPDIDPTAFQNVLRFPYTEDVSVEVSHVVSTLHAAKMCIVPALADGIVKFLDRIVDPENAIYLLH